MPTAQMQPQQPAGQTVAPADDPVLEAYRVRHEIRERLDAMEMERVWRDFQADPTDDVRNYLIEKYYTLVRYNAERVYTRLPDEVDVEDLVSAGLFGLMDAINAFDLDRGVKFETYCAQRIRGAILDELRSMDWVPRLVRHRTSRSRGSRGTVQDDLERRFRRLDVLAQSSAVPVRRQP